jgi:hypothetical protein
LGAPKPWISLRRRIFRGAICACVVLELWRSCSPECHFRRGGFRGVPFSTEELLFCSAETQIRIAPQLPRGPKFQCTKETPKFKGAKKQRPKFQIFQKKTGFGLIWYNIFIEAGNNTVLLNGPRCKKILQIRNALLKIFLLRGIQIVRIDKL